MTPHYCNSDFLEMRLAFIGSVGIPNRYGGFESFLEQCGPSFARVTASTVVTCDASFYQDDLNHEFLRVHRVFLKTRANGASSIVHDLFAFLRVYRGSTHIMVLGVSGGPWFPLFKLMCLLGGKRLGVNIDGVEWRRGKFSPTKQRILRLFDFLAQRFSDVIIYDNAGLAEYVLPSARKRAVEIGYSGDHVRRLTKVVRQFSTALTICRIEPENNLDLLIEGALNSDLETYTIVGNWSSSLYGRDLRALYAGNVRLKMLDPIYDLGRLAELRESCAIYLHGHSVGGTNPSLVEILYYDCAVLCFDVSYNFATAGQGASYFKDGESLASAINLAMLGRVGGDMVVRASLRQKYTRKSITNAYLIALQGRGCITSAGV